MNFTMLGECSINDDDEYFCDNGKVVLVLDAGQYIGVMKELSKIWDDKNKLAGQMLWIFKLLKESYESNYGMCCNIEFKSIQKKVVCPSCGRMVSLT